MNIHWAKEFSNYLMDAHVSSIIWYIIEDTEWLNWSHQNIKIFGLVNF